MSSHAELPEDIWKLVLQHVPLNQRLSSCALVCQKFKAAAVAATEHIEATLFEQPAFDNLTTYLQQHGSHLTSLILTGECSDDSSPPAVVELPCKHLQELRLINLSLGRGAFKLEYATAITRLEIQDTKLSGSCMYLAALSVLSKLQHLMAAICMMLKATAEYRLLCLRVCSS